MRMMVLHPKQYILSNYKGKTLDYSFEEKEEQIEKKSFDPDGIQLEINKLNPKKSIKASYYAETHQLKKISNFTALETGYEEEVFLMEDFSLEIDLKEIEKLNELFPDE